MKPYIYIQEVTPDGRGLKGKWTCGCGYAKNTFDTVLKRVDAACAKCGVEVILRVEDAYLKKGD